MATVFSLRGLAASGLALLVAFGALNALVSGDTGPGTPAARVHRLALNVERAESVRAVKRLQQELRATELL